MATTTTHYGFVKPGVNDYVDISVLNANFDNLDTVIYNNQLSAQAALDNIAPAYDATATYSVGDYVTYNKTLYKCTTAIATPEAFDDTKWTAVKVGGELKSHDERISNLEAGVELEGAATNSFDDGIDSYFKKVVSSIQCVQTGSGVPSPSNPRPIYGFNDCTVTDVDNLDTPTETNTVTISFGAAGTVYGGTVDLTTGVLTVTYGYVDLGSLNWNYGSKEGHKYFNASVTGIKQGDNYIPSNILCEKYETKSWINVYNNVSDYIIGVGNDYRVYIYDKNYTGATAFKTAMDGVQLVYELATPQTYQLTPAQLRSLVGANRLTSSTGEVTEVEYIKNKTIAWLLDLIRA